MKKVLLPALLVASLSACTVGTPGVSVGLGVGTSIGRHVGLGTSINIPVGLDKTKTTKGTDSDGIRISEEQIVTYFDAHGTPSNSAVKGGFHRQLISKRNNEYVVQDFYSDNSQKTHGPLRPQPQPTDAVPRHAKQWLVNHLRLQRHRDAAASVPKRQIG